MKQSWIFVAGVGLAVVLSLAAGVLVGEHKANAADGKTKSMSTDYFGAGGMQVTFLDDVKPEVRADLLKSELENYVRVFKPDHNYLATPYDGPGKNLGGAMIYVHDRRKVVTVEQYEQGR